MVSSFLKIFSSSVDILVSSVFLSCLAVADADDSRRKLALRASLVATATW